MKRIVFVALLVSFGCSSAPPPPQEKTLPAKRIPAGSPRPTDAPAPEKK